MVGTELNKTPQRRAGTPSHTAKLRGGDREPQSRKTKNSREQLNECVFALLYAGKNIYLVVLVVVVEEDMDPRSEDGLSSTRAHDVQMATGVGENLR